jgi:hypothetical protein
MLCDAFAAVLKSARTEFNARFAQAQRNYPALDAAAFAEFLETTADPLVRAVATAQPDAAADTARAAYDAALTLAGRQLAGLHARTHSIDDAWRKVLCAAAPIVAVAPERLISAVSNAVHNLAATPETRTADWIASLQTLAPRAGNADTLLQLGQVLAWRCGMAHYRNAALDTAGRLPAPLALAAVGAPETADWPTENTRLRANPWYVPGNTAPLHGFVMETGRFRGFGGLFAKPPRVIAGNDGIAVYSGDEAWRLHADAFGATFLRIAPDGTRASPQTKSRRPAGIALPAWLGNPTSVAETDTTIAVTGETTHSVLLFARDAA